MKCQPFFCMRFYRIWKKFVDSFPPKLADRFFVLCPHFKYPGCLCNNKNFKMVGKEAKW